MERHEADIAPDAEETEETVETEEREALTNQDLQEFFADSADMYLFLSQVLFKELTEEAIAGLVDAEFPVDTGNANLDEGYRLVRRYFKFADPDMRTQLACEYARIFLAAGVYTKSNRTAIPYESVFTSEERLMMGASRDDVVARFRQDGFQVNPDLHEPEDHVAFELEYLASLAGRAAEAVEGRSSSDLRYLVNRQLEFIDGHLLNWLPMLQKAAEESAKCTFYQGMLLVARGSLEQGRDMLQAILDQMDAPAQERVA